MLLEMAFILKPQIKIASARQAAEFFYMHSGLSGRLGQ
jgi:hypothetical protein